MLEVTRSGRRTVISTRATDAEVSARIRQGCAQLVGVAETDVDPSDVGPAFDLLRGSVEHGGGMRIRTMVRARGEVRPFADGSEVCVRFRPHWEAVAWMTFTSVVALVGLAVLIASLVSGSGPLLWPLGGATLFGGTTAWKMRQLSAARRDLESDLLVWLKR